MTNVQIFGVKNSQATRAAERFFKERSIPVHSIDLKQKPMAPAEIKRFVQRFTLTGLLDTTSKHYLESGMQYLKLSEAELLARIEREPALLRLPLVRAANKITIGNDVEGWKALLG
jgi:arsenate reductase-like glutaredoxin family protein